MPQMEDSGHVSSQAKAMMAAIRHSAPQLLQRVQTGLSKVELVSVPHPTWPYPRSISSPQFSSKNPLKISILDSSFNPPTLAHLALANSRRSQGSLVKDAEGGFNNAYDAKLLLLSVKNADKTLKPGDATYQQRLDMMSLLSLDVEPDIDDTIPFSTPTDARQGSNVAIAIIDEPTFVGKSQVLLNYLGSRFSEMPPPLSHLGHIELTFLVGRDTLERLFSQRYYPSEEVMIQSLRRFFSPAPIGDNSRFVSARRDMGVQPDDEDVMKLAQEFIDTGKITIIDMGDDVSAYSSTTVRRSLNSVGWGQDSLWRKLVTPRIAEYIVQQRLYVVGL